MSSPSQNEMCKRYGICKRIAMNQYKEALNRAQKRKKIIYKKYNRMSNLNFAPPNTAGMGWGFNNGNHFAQLKANAMRRELNSVYRPSLPTAEITYAGNSKKFWRVGRPHQQTDLHKLTQEKLNEKQKKYGTVVSGHVKYPGGRIGLFNKRVTNALNKKK